MRDMQLLGSNPMRKRCWILVGYFMDLRSIE